MSLTLLYRGPLSSCNYECHYCPFAKHHETAKELAVDRAALERFVAWVGRQATAMPGRKLRLFFTPWGEALVRRWYQRALIELSHQPHVEKVAIQTNLSCSLEWLTEANVSRLGLWCTFHPSQTTRPAFLSQCRQLDQFSVPYSVGAVGLKEDADEISRLRAELPAEIYLWINAYKQQPAYYTDEDVARFETLDPLFRINTEYHASLGRACRCGTDVLSIDGDGTIRRCHFIRQPLGSIYQDNWQSLLRDEPCPNRACGCHIGYIHMPHLNLEQTFGDGLLERIPRRPIQHAAARAE